MDKERLEGEFHSYTTLCFQNIYLGNNLLTPKIGILVPDLCFKSRKQKTRQVMNLRIKW